MRDGGWGGWSGWSECSARCGGGFRMRTRRCDSPPPQSPGGMDCPGCALDYELCNTAPCVDSKRLSTWTPWVPSGNGTERRFRFACRAPSPDPNLIKITQAKEEERICQLDGVCMRTGEFCLLVQRNISISCTGCVKYSSIVQELVPYIKMSIKTSCEYMSRNAWFPV